MTKQLCFTLVLLLSIGLVSAIDPIHVTTGGASSDIDSAELQGALSNLVAPEAEVWFNYGLSPTGPWSNSSIQNLTSNTVFSTTITGLNEDTTYYYRARGYDGLTGDTGSVLNFTTSQPDNQCETITSAVFDSFDIGVIALLVLTATLVIAALSGAFGGSMDIKSISVSISVIIVIALLYFIGVVIISKISGNLC